MKKLLTILLISLVLIGCSSKPKVDTPSTAASPESVAKEFLTAYRKMDTKKVNAFIVPEDQLTEEQIKEVEDERAQQVIAGVKPEEMMDFFFKSDFDVSQPTITDDKATVVVKWEGIDFGKTYQLVMTKIVELAMDPGFSNLSEEEQDKKIDELVVNMFKDGEAKPYESELHLRKVDNTWYVESSEKANKSFFNFLEFDFEPETDFAE